MFRTPDREAIRGEEVHEELRVTHHLPTLEAAVAEILQVDSHHQASIMHLSPPVPPVEVATEAMAEATAAATGIDMSRHQSIPDRCQKAEP